jgi:hypothetical protein
MVVAMGDNPKTELESAIIYLTKTKEYPHYHKHSNNLVVFWDSIQILSRGQKLRCLRCQAPPSLITTVTNFG